MSPGWNLPLEKLALDEHVGVNFEHRTPAQIGVYFQDKWVRGQENQKSEASEKNVIRNNKAESISWF